MSARSRRLFHRLQITAHRLQKSADREIGAAVDLTTAQAAVLSAIHNGEATTQRGVALALSLNESAVTPMVKRLIAKGYLTRARAPHDARAWALAITTSGKSTLEATKAPFARVNAILDRALAADEIDAFADALDRVNAALDPADGER